MTWRTIWIPDIWTITGFFQSGFQTTVQIPYHLTTGHKSTIGITTCLVSRWLLHWTGPDPHSTSMIDLDNFSIVSFSSSVSTAEIKMQKLSRARSCLALTKVLMQACMIRAVSIFSRYRPPRKLIRPTYRALKLQVKIGWDLFDVLITLILWP